MSTHPSKTVTVYTTGPACVQCNATKRWLNKHGIAFTEINITTSPEDANAARALGYTEAPVVVVSNGDPETDLHWSGFNPMSLANYTKQVA